MEVLYNLVAFWILCSVTRTFRASHEAEYERLLGVESLGWKSWTFPVPPRFAHADEKQVKQDVNIQQLLGFKYLKLY